MGIKIVTLHGILYVFIQILILSIYVSIFYTLEVMDRHNFKWVKILIK